MDFKDFGADVWSSSDTAQDPITVPSSTTLEAGPSNLTAPKQTPGSLHTRAETDEWDTSSDHGPALSPGITSSTFKIPDSFEQPPPATLGGENDDFASATNAGDGDVTDEFDNFGEASFTAGGGDSDVGAGDDDDFGDFGDFGEVEEPIGRGDASGSGFGNDGGGFGFAGPSSTSSTPWSETGGFDGFGGQALPVAFKSLDLSETSPEHTGPQIQRIFSAIFPDSTSNITSEPERQVDGLAQILVTEESRSLYTQLTKPPEVKPMDWKRSRIRRDHLIHLGVPIDLDEIAPASSKPLASLVLPPLQVSSLKPSTDGPMSAPARTGSSSRSDSLDNSNGSIYGVGSGTGRDRRFGEAPVIDRERIDEVLALKEDQLVLQTLPELQALKLELETLATSASTLLTHALQLREAYTQDGETYNSMIQDLVTSATKRQIKTTSSASSSFSVKRSSSIANSRPSSNVPNSSSATSSGLGMGWKRSASPAPITTSGALSAGAKAMERTPSASGTDRRFSVR